MKQQVDKKMRYKALKDINTLTEKISVSFIGADPDNNVTTNCIQIPKDKFVDIGEGLQIRHVIPGEIIVDDSSGEEWIVEPHNQDVSTCILCIGEQGAYLPPHYHTIREFVSVLKGSYVDITTDEVFDSSRTRTVDPYCIHSKLVQDDLVCLLFFDRPEISLSTPQGNQTYVMSDANS